MDKIIFHIDANSAYLSWTAVDMLDKGHPLDIRDIPSAISGDPANRHGIILTKSIPAKKFKVQTGESIYEAKKKCPTLKCYAPDYDLYTSCSEAFVEILNQYSPKVERYSIDECFLDYSESKKYFGDPLETADHIRNRIKNELGFTVNVGISTNKLLAKMGSELKKPNRTHTLFPDEIATKMWSLPVEELFFVGRATKRKLNGAGITTIGQLANSDLKLIKGLLHNVHGETVWNFANGIDVGLVAEKRKEDQKGVGNSTTIAYDVATKSEAYEVMLALTEKVGMRLRKLDAYASIVSVYIRPSNFERHGYGHQRKLNKFINATTEIYQEACTLFDEMWQQESLRKIGIHVGGLSPHGRRQLSLFDNDNTIQSEFLDIAVDNIREIYGNTAIKRGTFINREIDAVQGGVREEEYRMMGGYDS